ncbi:hypothetical protein AB0K51_07275 [Kitasatospora sp. NPDC049285]|uniref:hypothetical protein n=1 Tax=Kitasatospora sp. NPDC049285 TaxID=3157096 RepID=UPI00341EB24A
MSNDEPAWYETEATARVEPEHLSRLVAQEATPAFRVGTVATEGVPLEPLQARTAEIPAEPLLQARVGTVQAEPLMQARVSEAIPAEPMLQGRLTAQQMEPMEGRLTAQQVQPMEGRLTAQQMEPMEGRLTAQQMEPMEGRLTAQQVEPRLQDLTAQRTEPRLQDLTAAVPAERRLKDAVAAEPATADAVAAEPLRRMTGTVPAQQAQARTGMEAAKRSASSGDGGGGAGQGFQVNPEQYQAAVSPMLAASEQVRSLYTSLSAFLPSLEAQNPWGNDESGKKFAEGEKGYLKYSKDTLDVVKGLPDALKGIADGLKAMAENYQGADESITSEFNGMDLGDNPMPLAPTLPSAPLNNPVHIPVTPRISQSGRH